MRQVFSSARIENVEAVAQLLRDAGIEARVVNGRGWRGAIRGNFSYRNAASKTEHPSVWVVRSDDHPPARALLRENGLLESARAPDMSYLPLSVHSDKIGRSGGNSAQRRVTRINLALIVIIAAIVGLSLFGARRMGLWLPSPASRSPAPVAASVSAVDAPPPPMPVTLSQVHRIATPPMLAETIALREAASPQQGLCLSIDGNDPPPDSLQRLRESMPSAKPASQCAQESMRIAVDDYRTDGSGVGTVQVEWKVPDAEPRERTLHVQREGMRWRVLQEK